ncbi:major capsid protein [Mycolicibacterium komossense]|uniref:Major capsid protein n=1 Tax=Mycolicibacterium komossense TaxID=1779 RepID=A0ABT3CMU1_9MYCO|nr:major capsid protein [Mycolicibacterium komossense]MCV7230673.1 hypothetical protein [Mycolicibacterium komossense]
MAYASPVTYPLGPPTVSGTTLTVDGALKQPGRITKRISDLTLQRFITTELFSQSGASTASGAIIYDAVTANELYLKNDVEERGPTDEYPLVSSERLAPKVARSEDWGGKFPVSDEAVTRNDIVHLNNQTTQLANTIVRKVNQRAVAVLEDVIANAGGAATIPGHDWSDIQTGGTSPTPMQERPLADLLGAQLAADVEELGIEYNVWIMNPQEWFNLQTAYDGNAATILDKANVSTFVSNRVTAGTAYAAQRGQVGFLDYEKQLQTETWREPGKRTSWVQSFVMPIMGVTNVFAVKKITGLAG